MLLWEILLSGLALGFLVVAVWIAGTLVLVPVYVYGVVTRNEDARSLLGEWTFGVIGPWDWIEGWHRQGGTRGTVASVARWYIGAAGSFTGVAAVIFLYAWIKGDL